MSAFDFRLRRPTQWVSCVNEEGTSAQLYFVEDPSNQERALGLTHSEQISKFSAVIKRAENVVVQELETVYDAALRQDHDINVLDRQLTEINKAFTKAFSKRVIIEAQDGTGDDEQPRKRARLFLEEDDTGNGVTQCRLAADGNSGDTQDYPLNSTDDHAFFVRVGQQSTESQAYDVLHVGASTSADMGAFDGGMSMEELIGQDEWRKLSDAAALLNGGRNYTAGNRKQLRLYAAEAGRHSSAPAAFNADALDEGHKAFPYELGACTYAWEHMQREYVDAVRLVANVLVAGEASRDGDDHTDWVAVALEPIEMTVQQKPMKSITLARIEMKALRQDDACIF